MKIRVTVLLPKDKHAELEIQAKRKGISTPTYCTMLLSEWAEVPAEEIRKTA